MKKLIILTLCLLLAVCGCAHAESGECEHADSYYENDTSKVVYTSVDEYLHHAAGHVTEVMVCYDCGEQIPSDEYELDEDEPHYYDMDGVCALCGNICTHSSEYSYEEERDREYRPGDAKNHMVVCDLYTVNACEFCGKVMSEALTQEDFSYEIIHFFRDGFCEYCGEKNTCAHENAETYQYNEFRDCVPQDEKLHILIGDLYEETSCYECGEMISYKLIEENRQETEAHSFSGGVCYYCGTENTCAHENTVPEEDYSILECRQKNDFYHTMVSELYEVNFCADCGEAVSTTLLDDEYLVDSDHWFWDGECIECGYVDALSERVRLMGRVIADVKSLETFATDGITVELLNADAVLSADELAIFESLPMTEQALALLTAVGYADAVQDALAHELMTPSDEIAALLTTISSRISGLTEADAAAHTEKLDELFPVNHVSAENIDMRTIQIMISSPENNGAMTEIFSLIYSEENNDWYFEMTSAG